MKTQASDDLAAIAPGNAGRPGRRYLDKQEMILTAAARLLARGGSEDFALTVLARDLGLNPVSISYYYRRKEDLAAAVLGLTVRRFVDIIAVAEGAGTPQARLARFVALYFEARAAALLEGQPPLVRFSEVRLVDGRSRQELEIAIGGVHLRLTEMLKCPDMPWMTNERRQTLARFVISFLNWCDPWLWQYAPRDFARVAERVSDLMTFGLASGDADWEMLQTRRSPPAAEEDTRERFLSAAIRVINLEGYRGASVDRLSAEVNLTKGSFYHHLATKDELLIACFGRSFRLARSAIDAGEGDTGWERLSEIAVNLSALQLGERGELLLRPTALAAGPDDLRRARLVEYVQLVNGLADVVGEGVADGSVRAVDPGLGAHYVMMVIAVLGALRSTPCAAQRDLREAFLRPALTGFFRP